MAASRKAKKTRKDDEFRSLVDAARVLAALQPPPGTAAGQQWQLADIRNARDAQMRGHFEAPARMAAAMRTDDALFTARDNRLAPQRCISVEIKPAKGARGEAIAAEAEALYGEHGVGIATGTMADINGCLADHGIAIGYNVPIPRDDGSRVDIEHRYWPIEFVRWDAYNRTLLARVDPHSAPDLPQFLTSPGIGIHEIPITHGDGVFTVYQKHSWEPWKQDACILPGAFIWARHAHALRDWARGSTAHGNAKVVGEMPPGMALQNKDGSLTTEATAFLELLKAIASLDLPVGIRPSGSKTDYVMNTSTAWQVWLELVNNADKAAARVYLGTDGILGAQGGAPGVDISALLGVAITKVQGDLGTITRCFKTGVLDIWAAINFGDSTLAPIRGYMMPDADAQTLRRDLAERNEAFHRDVKAYREGGFIVDQDTIDQIASLHGVLPPTLPPSAEKAPAIALAPTDLVAFVRVNEARASAGLGPLTLPDGSLDPDGFLMGDAYKAKTAAKAAAAAATPPAAPLRAV